MRDTKGITLIALIITIIVMLILTGVTINLTLGENGLFSTTKKAVNMQKVAEYKDRVEIARANVIASNLGKITLDKLIEQIYKDKIVPEGGITKINENEAEMITPEGYKFKITLDGIEYIDQNGDIVEPPVEDDIPVATGNVTIGELVWDPITHKASVKITKSSNIENNLSTQYQVVESVEDLKEENWKTGTNVNNINVNQTVFVRLWDGKKGGNYTSLKIVDKIQPSVVVNISQIEINSITANVGSSDLESGMPENPIYTFYIKKTGEEDIHYEQKQSDTRTQCIFTGLEQNTSYTVKATTNDNAQNVGTGIKEVLTGTQKVTRITLNKTTLEIEKGEKETLTANIEPIDAYNKDIAWSSNDENIATVSSTGEVLGIGEGTTTITVSATDGSGVLAQCNVTIKPSAVPLASVVNIGDYVAYNPADTTVDSSKLSYTSPKGTGTSHGNGEADQTFDVNNTNATIRDWRVFSKNETTGEVILINKQGLNPVYDPNVGDNFRIKGVVGYLYAEQEINSACAIYGYGKGANTTKTHTYTIGDINTGTRTGTITSGARSVTVDDFNTLADYTPPTDRIIIEGIYRPSLSKETGMEKGDVNYPNGKYYYTFSSDFSNKYSFIDTFPMNGGIFLASRLCGVEMANRIDIGIYTVNRNLVAYKNYTAQLWAYGSNSSTTIKGWICPIVYLKTTVKTTGKNINGAWIIVDE